ncbi:MAG: M20/M25/M40 family metallo-hydrolase [Gemmatimonadota bacterium]|nr:MAG: M20/M25/M40 family metallo-hydrolase [Gemmatimonadota bacterium]
MPTLPRLAFASGVLGFATVLGPAGLPAQVPAARTEAEAVAFYVDAHRREITAELLDFLALPNVAADTENIRRNAARLVEMMEARGIRTRLLETDGPPMVFGELPVPGATRTILFYCHYDGQPTDASRWVGHAPWDPVLRDGNLESSPETFALPAEGPIEDDWRIYGRSASDDKSPIVALLSALDALEAAGLQPTSNLKFLFEGDEEAGSPHLDRLVREHEDLLVADLAVIADGPRHSSGRPTAVFGVRGIVTAEITVYGPTVPLHSGHYGNWAPNPAEALAELLATAQDEDGRVTIAGWYEDVLPLGPADAAALAALPDEEEERRRLGIALPEGGGRSRWEMVTLPSFNVRGMWSAWVGDQARTIVPDRAIASLDFRLVRDIQPRQQVERFVGHVIRQGYHVVSEEPDLATRLGHPKLAKIESTRGYPAVRTPLDDPAARAVVEAVREATGEEPVVIPTHGGSVPGHVFPDYLGATFVLLPIVNPDNNQHSPNENLRLGNLFSGISIFAGVMRMP